MCGRGRRGLTFSEVAKLYRAEFDGPMPGDERALEVRPTEALVVVRGGDGKRKVGTMRWGLVPPWAPDLKFGSKTFNARSETASEKPAFRSAWKKQRCLVIFDGFYEWSGVPRKPNLVRLPNDAPMAMAGLWETWHEPLTGEVVESCTVLTREAKGPMATIHDRMPIILDESVHDTWLDPATKDIAGVLDRCAVDELEIVPLERIGPPPKPPRQGSLF